MSITALRGATCAYRRQTPSIWQAMGRAIWETLEATGRRRAARQLHDLARRWAAIDPVLAAQMGAAAQSLTEELKDTP